MEYDHVDEDEDEAVLTHQALIYEPSLGVLCVFVFTNGDVI